VLHLLPEIEDAAVVGVADTQWGERPVAVVVIRAGAAFDPDALREHCRRHLAAFKVPSRFVQRDVLPRNPSGKLLKRVLRDEFAVTAAGTTGGTK
jgi:fatty-acyl-CoA synthase